jgi:7-cyano-7-deazaguanine reductase
MSRLKYGEKEIASIDPKKLELWKNPAPKNKYLISITLPEFTCKCPRSGYPDFAKIIVNYIPDKWVIELKAIKLYINTFRERYISHEAASNEIYTTLKKLLKPKYLQVIADFNPRGNVHTIITIPAPKDILK